MTIRFLIRFYSPFKGVVYLLVPLSPLRGSAGQTVKEAEARADRLQKLSTPNAGQKITSFGPPPSAAASSRATLNSQLEGNLEQPARGQPCAVFKKNTEKNER